MAPTFVLLTVFQLLTTALCITSVDDTSADAAKDKDIGSDRLKDDLETDETGWIYNPIQEKVRTLEYLKSRVFSPFATLQSPSTFYGGSYPIYYSSSGGGLSSSFSYGSKYPYYYSNGYKNNYYSGYNRPGVVSYPASIQLKNKFNGYPSFNPIQKPFYTPKLWYNKGSYGGSSYYAPDCSYTSFRPSPTYTPSYSYSNAGTPLSYQYSTTYGVPSTYSSSKPIGFGLKSYSVPSYSHEAGQSSGSFPSNSYPSLPSPQIPSAPQVPTGPYIPSLPNFPSYPTPTLPSYPSLPTNPTNTFLFKSVIFPQRASDDSQSSSGSLPSIPYYPGPALPSVPTTPSPSIPSPPSSLGLPSAPTVPTSVPNVPYAPSPPSIPSTPSLGNLPVPYNPVQRQEYSVLVPSPNVQSIENETPEVVITPAPQTKAKTNLIAALPGSSISILSDQYPYAPPYGYAVSNYPTVFYISNQQNNERPSAALGSESSGDSQSVQPIPSDESTDSTPSSESSTETSSRRSSRPVITSFYSSNTIDQTRIPLLYTGEQYTVPAGGVFYSSPVIASDPPSFSYNYGPSLGGVQALPQTNSNSYAYSSSGLVGPQAAQPLTVTTASPPC